MDLTIDRTDIKVRRQIKRIRALADATLPRPYARLFKKRLAESTKWVQPPETTNETNFVIQSFYWSHTPEDMDFWIEVQTYIENLSDLPPLPVKQ